MQELGNISISGKHKKKENAEQTLTLVSKPHTKHSSKRSNKLFLHNNRILFIVILIGILAAWIYFIPPSNSWAVYAFIVVLTCIFSIITSFLGTKIQYFSTLFIFLFLIMSYIIGFDIINTLVLLSFIIGLSTLFKLNNS